MSEIGDQATLRRIVHEKLAATAVLDIHTHLYEEAFGGLLLRGPQELLTYHYLQAETNRVLTDISPRAFMALNKAEQARLIWRALFVERSPLSEATRGVVTTWRRLGLPDVRDYEGALAHFAGMTPAEHMDLTFRAANVSRVIMTNDPLDPAERVVWDAGGKRDSRFLAALRIDSLLLDWPATAGRLAGLGYAATDDLNETACSEIPRFLRDWARKMDAVYMAASLPPTFQLDDGGPAGQILQRGVLPICRELGLPFAMMIGVKRRVMPDLGPAGDGLGRCDLDTVSQLCRAYPDNKFLLTVLARENQHEAVVLARKFRNLHLFGCWWFNNNPSIIEELTRERIEMLGLSMTPQHSDARILDQLAYKWAHSRQVIAGVLCEKYGYLLDEGWYPTEAEIGRDVELLLGGEFERFLGKSL